MAKIIGIIERLDLRVWDTHVIDEAEGLVRYEPNDHLFLFTEEADDDRLCNAPSPVGRLTNDRAWRVTAVGLGLHFSEPELYTEVFRHMTITLEYRDRDVYGFTAQQFLDRAIARGFDPQPGLGFAWSQQLGRSASYPGGEGYRVRLELSRGLSDRLRAAAAGVRQGDEAYRHWFSEIRVFLLGVSQRRIQDREAQ